MIKKDIVMVALKPIYKKMCICILILIVSALHYGTIGHELSLHIIHRELYFIPILFASFWYGLSGGVLTSIVVSIVYAFHAYIFGLGHEQLLALLVQIAVFILIAILLGLLSDKKNQEHKESIKNENLAVLGRAAAIIGHVLTEHFNSLSRLLKKDKNCLGKDTHDRIQSEIERITLMVDVLSTFVPKEDKQKHLNDLNPVILDRINHLNVLTKEKAISLVLNLDKNTCASELSEVHFGRMFDDILKNAIEFSAPGGKIFITSKADPKNTKVSIRDEGPGINASNMKKIFTPFFTTRENGHGLSLAACKKVLNDSGGDIEVNSIEGQGAEFVLIIPKKDPDSILDMH
jgi:signal transduction histidine kinase